MNQGQNSNLGFNCWSSKQDVQIFPQSNKPSVNGVISTQNALLDQQEMYLYLLAICSSIHFKHYIKMITSKFLAPSKEIFSELQAQCLPNYLYNSFIQLLPDLMSPLF